MALWFAPEAPILPILSNAEHLNVIKLDIERSRQVDLLADIHRLPARTDSIDLIWCHHVLEHIEDDRAAVWELHRVLKPKEGEMVLSVPMGEDYETREYGRAVPEESGHWRLYGDELGDLLSNAGFKVEALRMELKREEMDRYVIHAEKYFICKKR